MINGNGGIREGREYVARLEFRLCSIFVPGGRLSNGVVTRNGLQRDVLEFGVKEKKKKMRSKERKRERQPPSSACIHTKSQPALGVDDATTRGSTEITGSLSLETKRKMEVSDMTAHTYIQHTYIQVTAVCMQGKAPECAISRGRPSYVKVASFSGTFSLVLFPQ